MTAFLMELAGLGVLLLMGGALSAPVVRFARRLWEWRQWPHS